MSCHLLAMYCAGHHKVVKVLQENGANLNFLYDSESNAVTPLMFAVQYAGMMRQQQQPWVQHGAVIQILLRGGCDGKINKHTNAPITYTPTLCDRSNACMKPVYCMSTCTAS
jgi:hypothetical protein